MKKFILTLSIYLFAIGHIHAACDSLNTIYGYTYLNHGAMFNVVAGDNITLDHLTSNIKNGTFKYFIYYKTGSFVGFETDPGAWTLIDSANVTSANNGSTISNQPTVIPINLNLNMYAGDTIAFYLTAPTLSSVYLTSTTIPWATEYSADSKLSISVARSIYQYHGTPFSTPQIWNGSVAYCETGPVTVSEISEMEKVDFDAIVSESNLNILIQESVLNKYSNIEFQMIDILSKKINKKEIKSDLTSFNLNNISRGVYVCTLRSNDSIIAVKKILIE